jgi:hypothetical protein
LERPHPFFAAAAESMRRILIDNARRKKSLKHGGEHRRIYLDKLALSGDNNTLSDDLLALDEALEKLAKENKIEADGHLLRIRLQKGDAQVISADSFRGVGQVEGLLFGKKVQI